MKRKGRHPDKALSAVQVRSLKVPGRYADGNGLYLVVDESGAKRWLLRTVVHGKRRDIGLGGAALVSLAEARDQALAYRKTARSGGDPLAERRKARAIVPDFASAAEQVHAEHKASWKNAKHASQWINTLRQYAVPHIGDRRVDQIGTPEILKVLAPIWLTKPETARRLKQRIGTVLDWAKAAGYRDGDNPVVGVSKGLPKQGGPEVHHAALPYSQVPAFVRSLQESSVGELVRLGLEFLILSASRTGEVIAADWDEFNLDQRLWVVPAARMKAKRPHRVPLSTRAVAVLERTQEISGKTGYVFPGRSKKQPLSNMAFLMAMRRMGLSYTVHGFRSSFRDWAAEQTSFPREVAEMALAHTIANKVEAAYRRGDLLEKRRELMDAWATFIGEPK